MRDDTTPPRDTRDPNHIWLRQSVTFTVNGQTRTLELALPLRPGATPEEVDALLDEADAGMRRLSQRLDAHLAEVTGAAPTIITPAASPALAARPEPAPEPAPRRVAPPSAATPPEPPPVAPQPAIAERPAPRPTAPAPSVPATAQPSRVAHAAPAAPTSGGPDLTRPEFLAATGALGLDARTVMERLNVRSLNGLNLREALDLLRRQVLREGGASADPEPTPDAMPGAMPAPIGRARFDEEDEEDDAPDFELSYPDPDDLPSDDDYSGEDDFAPLEAAPEVTPARRAPTAAPAAPLSDVPDLDDLLGAPQPATSPADTAGVAPATPAADPATARAREVIATLRAAHPGGQAVAQQRMAYRNIVLGQLGEAKTASVVRAVWGITPDRLGPEQFDAFTRWGKEDAFVEEAEDALNLLRAEWIAQQAQQAAEPPSGATRPAAQPAQPRRPSQEVAQEPAQQPAARPASRGRPAAPRANTTGASRDGAGPQGGV